MEAGEPNMPPIEPAHIPSLAIERILTAELGRERFLPARFLYGLVPDALLNAYSFWKNKPPNRIIAQHKFRAQVRVPAEVSRG